MFVLCYDRHRNTFHLVTSAAPNQTEVNLDLLVHYVFALEMWERWQAEHEAQDAQSVYEPEMMIDLLVSTETASEWLEEVQRPGDVLAEVTWVQKAGLMVVLQVVNWSALAPAHVQEVAA